MEPDAETNDVFRIRIHHIGGVGGYGPVEAITRLGDVEWIIYDAQEDSLSSANAPNAPFRRVKKGIGGANLGRVKFYVTNSASASSLFPPAQKAARYSLKYPDGRLLIWGTHSSVNKTVEIEVSTIDSLVENHVVPPVDFLSIDAQGAELQILKGASKMLTTTTLGIFCEVEFAELYDKQPLFCDIQSYVNENHFRLCEIDSLNYYNTEPLPWEALGKGFLTVGEAIFLKENRALATSDATGQSRSAFPLHAVQRLKLAAIAVAFDQLDYAIKICHELEKDEQFSLDALAKKTNVKYIKLLEELYHAEGFTRPTGAAESLETKRTSGGLDNTSVIINMTKIAFAFLSVVAQTGVRRVASRILGRKSDLFYPPLSKIFSRYGLDELAIKYAFRSKRLFYLNSNRGVRFLDFMAQIISGFG